MQEGRGQRNCERERRGRHRRAEEGVVGPKNREAKGDR